VQVKRGHLAGPRRSPEYGSVQRCCCMMKRELESGDDSYFAHRSLMASESQSSLVLIELIEKVWWLGLQRCVNFSGLIASTRSKCL
jgi:hypothetical protein